MNWISHLALHESSELGERQRRPVRLGHKQTLQDDLVKLAFRSPHQEAVKLHQKGLTKSAPRNALEVAARLPYLYKQSQVHILALRGRAVCLLAAATGLEVDTLST